MSKETRTSKSVKNAQIALLFYLLNLILQFYSRKIFLNYLGSEVLGLNTTAQNLINFLNLAELGIGAAVSYSLYKPLLDNNKNVINDIISIQGWLYRKIAYIVIISGIILMFFFPLIFSKTDLPLWYTYGSFISLSVAALLSYFVNYNQIILSADQKEYKITRCTQITKIIKVILQIIAIYYLKNGYLWWMIIEVLMSIITAYTIDYTVKKNYPWLKTEIFKGKILQQKYPEISSKTKQIFFHKFATFVLTQTSPLVIYAFSSLTLVAIYGNYMLIITGVTLLTNALLNSIAAGVGNLVAEGRKEHIKSVFWEIFTLKFWIASVICFGIYILGDSFIGLWVGKEYLLPTNTFIILICIAFINLSRTADTFIFAYGMFQDIWAPIVEAILNLSLSITLGYYYGITGILTGVLISLIILVCVWKPYFLYRWGFKDSFIEYMYKYIKLFITIGCIFSLNVFLINHYIKSDIDTYYEWGMYAIIYISIYTLISLCTLYILNKPAQQFIQRFIQIILKR